MSLMYLHSHGYVTDRQFVLYVSDDALEYLYRVQGKVAFVLFVEPENREFLAAKDFLTHAIDDYQFRTIPNWTYL